MFGQAAFDQKPSSKLASGRHLNHSCTGRKVPVIWLKVQEILDFYKKL